MILSLLSTPPGLIGLWLALVSGLHLIRGITP